LNEIESAAPGLVAIARSGSLARPRPRPRPGNGRRDRRSREEQEWQKLERLKACKQSQDEALSGEDAEPRHDFPTCRWPQQNRAASPSSRRDERTRRSQLSDALWPKSSLSRCTAQLCVGVANS